MKDMEKVLDDYLYKLLREYKEQELIALEQLSIDFIDNQNCYINLKNQKMKNQNYLEELKQALYNARYDLATAPNYTHIALFDEDGELNDDAYQESLELNYWKDEQRDLIQQLEIEIERVENELDVEIAMLLSKQQIPDAQGCNN